MSAVVVMRVPRERRETERDREGEKERERTEELKEIEEKILSSRACALLLWYSEKT